MAKLDHVVINARDDTDAAEAIFAALGFQLTPRGYHTLGSLNHLMMTRGAYLEIVGVPSEGRQRQEILDSPRGLNGIVLKTDDADGTFARLAEAGFDPLPPMDFSRPVTIDGVDHDASFRTVRMMPDFFGGGRVYFCQHLTPELVWRDEWLGHGNGFRAIDRVEVESIDPATVAARFALAFDGKLVEDGRSPRVLLEDCDIVVRAGASDRMLTTGLVFSDTADIAAKAEAAGVEVTHDPSGQVVIALPGLDATLTCRSGP
jgi:hypothetical protein